jgi:hypothetical protein
MRGGYSRAGKGLGQRHVALQLRRYFFLQPVGQPFFKLMLRALRNIDEPDTGVPGPIGPGDLALQVKGNI